MKKEALFFTFQVICINIREIKKFYLYIGDMPLILLLNLTSQVQLT